jgi:hypothetical protein
MQNIPEVSNNTPYINNAEFVKLTVYNDVSNTANVNVYTFSSSYKSENIGGTVYTPLGGLLAVGVQNRDLRVTSSDTSISLSGISGNNISVVLGTKIKGSKIEILRGFYNNNYVLGNTYTRFTGICTSYNISEDRQGTEDNFTVTVNASSYKTVLENRIAGRFTNRESWQEFNSTDSSMNNVYSIANQQFDFGKAPTTAPVNNSGAGQEQQIVNETYITEQP